MCILSSLRKLVLSILLIIGSFAMAQSAQKVEYGVVLAGTGSRSCTTAADMSPDLMYARLRNDVLGLAGGGRRPAGGRGREVRAGAGVQLRAVGLLRWRVGTARPRPGFRACSRFRHLVPMPSRRDP